MKYHQGLSCEKIQQFLESFCGLKVTQSAPARALAVGLCQQMACAVPNPALPRGAFGRGREFKLWRIRHNSKSGPRARIVEVIPELSDEKLEAIPVGLSPDVARTSVERSPASLGLGKRSGERPTGIVLEEFWDSF